MRTADWLALVQRDANKLRSLILDYHPASSHGFRGAALPITAPNAERACAGVREAIADADEQRDELDPVKRFDRALEDGDANALASLLSGAWFGVPESTSCWRIEGFAACVDLMDDPPETEP